MNSQQESIKAASLIANIFWPEFVVVDDYVFFSWAAPESINPNKWHDRTEVESTVNHTHVLDLFNHNASIDEEPWWDQSHPDFKAGCSFGLVWAEAVASKLERDFPERNFFIYYTEQDNPIVRFHQEHPGETPWINPENCSEEIAAGTVVIHRVCGYNNASQTTAEGGS